MGLIAWIYKSSDGDCSNYGVSSRVNQLTIINVDGPFDPTPERPAAVLRQGTLSGTVNIVPASKMESGNTMFGGCYVAASDSRFREAVEQMTGHRFYGAVPLHDRVE